MEVVEEIQKGFKKFVSEFAEKTGLPESYIAKVAAEMYLSGKIEEKKEILLTRGVTQVKIEKKESIWEFVRPT
ncbi:MAG: hypothetical protein RMI31_03170 [Archaeoglobaceae archaeon]|nr:hypothetical protein [Archaeoglobaceae archaeon]